MKNMVFFNIAWMNYYKGNINNTDVPENGGSYVNIYKDAHEKYNFQPISLVFEKEDDFSDGEYCLGFVETKANKSGNINSLHIERIMGCELMKKEESVSGITVVFCANFEYHKRSYVVGWYKDATVYRQPQLQEFFDENGEKFDEQWYFSIASKDNCVLLPKTERFQDKWRVPRRSSGYKYGFGQSNQWFAENSDQNIKLNEFLQDISRHIDNYDGENWIDTYPE